MQKLFCLKIEMEKCIGETKREREWERSDVTPPSPIAPSSPSPSPLKGPITRSMMKKIQMGLPIDGHKSNGLVTLFSWAKEINKT